MRVSRTAILVLPLLVGVLGAGLNTSATAAPTAQVDTTDARSGAKEAKAMLEQAVIYLKNHGAERAFAAFNNQKGSFYRKDLYTFVVGIDDGIMHAHGGAPEGLVGTDVRELRDASGKPIVQEMLGVATQPDGGTVNYVWLNRVNNRIENKHSRIERVDNYLIGVGYYTP